MLCPTIWPDGTRGIADKSCGHCRYGDNPRSAGLADIDPRCVLRPGTESDAVCVAFGRQFHGPAEYVDLRNTAVVDFDAELRTEISHGGSRSANSKGVRD